MWCWSVIFVGIVILYSGCNLYGNPYSGLKFYLRNWLFAFLVVLSQKVKAYGNNYQKADNQNNIKWIAEN